jgi:CRISPR-associated protein Csm2
MPTSDVVFRFSMSDLDRALERGDPRRKAREREFLSGKFKDWGLKDTDVVQLAQPALRTIIVDPDGTGAAVQWGEKLGTIFKSLQLTSSQIRGVFGTVRQIEMAWRPSATAEEQRAANRRLLLLKPKLAYQAKRQAAVEGLAHVLSLAIDLVGGDRDNFQRFVDFFESILAYHVAAGGQ